MSEGKSNVVNIGRGPAVVRPEMQARWLMSVVDKLQAVAIVVKLEGIDLPVVATNTRISPYFLSLAGTLLHDAALETMQPEEDDDEPAA